MSRRGEPHETFEVGGCTVNIWHDEWAEGPDAWGDDERFIYSESRDFRVEPKGWCSNSFTMFIRPDLREDVQDSVERGFISGPDEPTAKPQDGPDDPLWREVYIKHCKDNLMQILHAAGEEIDWTDASAMSEAYRDWGARMDLWDAWQEYRKAHAEWACYELDVRYYGGGHYQLSVGDLYEGDHTDQWGRPTSGPDGYVMIKREDGIDLAKAAESLVDIWNQYLEGDVWFFAVLDENGEQVESCGGYYGLDDCITEARSVAEHHNNNRQKEAV